jgi:protein involved in polysaccharide export with SLBB domain
MRVRERLDCRRSRRQVAAKAVAVLLSWALVPGPTLLNARGAQEQQGGSGDQHDTATYGREARTGLMRHSSTDLVAENLSRVAATAEQILSVLNRDTGMMVEFKLLYAQDAGQHGQLLEETDLSDAVIADRLHQDPRLRAMATRFLQRYGYFQPRLNPDSDAAEEHALMMHQRATELQRTAAGQQLGMPASAIEKTSGCDGRPDANCGGAAPRPAPQQPAAPRRMESAPQRVPDLSAVSPELLRAGAAQGGNYEALLASLRSTDGESGLAGLLAARGQSSPVRSPLSSIINSPVPPPASPSEPLSPPENSPTVSSAELLRSGTVSDLLRDYRGAQPGGALVEPVRMVRQRNPYGQIPALYDLYVQAESSRPTQRFGLDVFERGAASIDPSSMDVPVGPEYIVGPGDGLMLDLWGGVSQRLPRTVDREGRLDLPEVGPTLVAGKSLGEVQQEVQRLLRMQFRNVSADVSLQRLRTVRVYVVGEVNSPGAYDVSSMSTPLNALFTAGGVTTRGSLRRVEHYRGSQMLEEVDVYELVLHGVRGKPQRLESGDSLRVPPLGPTVTVEGMVRRPAIYELRGEKNLEDVLDLSGGILPAAALRHIEVQRLVAHEKHTMFSLDLGETSDSEGMRANMRKFAVQDGDEIHIFPIAPYNTAAVYLEGHVLRPGRYSYQEGMRLNELIGSYKDLLPEPSGRYAEIIRLKGPDYRPVVESFNLTNAIEHPENAPKLEPLDTVRVFGRYDFESAPEIVVSGEVREPGRYGTSGQPHLRDVLFQAGGLTPDAWLDSAQVFRRMLDGTTKVFSVNLRDALDGNAHDNLLLEPRDRVLVHRQPDLQQPRSVYVQGDVAHPGRYPLADNMRVSDLIRSAGGVLRSANLQNGALTQYVQADAVGRSGETSTVNVPVNLAAALEGTEKGDPLLHAGDVLTVPQRTGWKDIGASVSVRGEVRNPGGYGIRPGERLSAVLERAGGFTGEAYPYGAVLTRREVRDVEMRAHQELVERVKLAQAAMKSLPEGDENQRNAKTTALAQAETTLEQLEANAPVGRVVIHINSDVKNWRNTTADPVLRDGDVLVVPTKPNTVTVTGQVFHATSINYRPGRNTKWYLTQAGGFTPLASKEGAFVIRADGSVIAAKNNSGWWSGNPMSAALKPGDSIIVPEKIPNVGTRNWTLIMQMAQIASSAALTAAYVVK